MTDTSEISLSVDTDSLIFTTRRTARQTKGNWFEVPRQRLIDRINGIDNCDAVEAYENGMNSDQGINPEMFKRGFDAVWVQAYVKSGELAYPWLIMDVEDPHKHHDSIQANIDCGCRLIDKLGEFTEGMTVALSGSGLRFMWNGLIPANLGVAFDALVKSKHSGLSLPGVDTSPWVNRSQMYRFGVRALLQEFGESKRNEDGRPRSFYFLDSPSDLLNLSAEEYKRLVYSEVDYPRFASFMARVIPDGRMISPGWIDYIRREGINAHFQRIVASGGSAGWSQGYEALPAYVPEGLNEAIEARYGYSAGWQPTAGGGLLVIPECPMCGRSTGNPRVNTAGFLHCFHQGSCQGGRWVPPSEWLPNWRSPLRSRAVNSECGYVEPEGYSTLEEAQALLPQILNGTDSVFINLPPGAGKTRACVQYAIEQAREGKLVLFSTPQLDAKEELRGLILGGLHEDERELLFDYRSRNQFRETCPDVDSINYLYQGGMSGRDLICSNCENVSSCEYLRQHDAVVRLDKGIIICSHAMVGLMAGRLRKCDIWICDEDPTKAIYIKETFTVRELIKGLRANSRFNGDIPERWFRDISKNTVDISQLNMAEVRRVATKLEETFANKNEMFNKANKSEVAAGNDKVMYGEARAYATEVPAILDSNPVRFEEWASLTHGDLNALRAYFDCWNQLEKWVNRLDSSIRGQERGNLEQRKQEIGLHPKVIRFFEMFFKLNGADKYAQAYAAQSVDGKNLSRILFTTYKRTSKAELPKGRWILLDGTGDIEEFRSLNPNLIEHKVRLPWLGDKVHVSVDTTKSAIRTYGELEGWVRKTLRHGYSLAKEIKQDVQEVFILTHLSIEDCAKSILQEDEFKELGVSWHIGHFGKCRSVNTYSDCEGVIQLGDYRLSSQAVVDDCVVLGLSKEQTQKATKKHGKYEMIQGIHRVRGVRSEKFLISMTKKWPYADEHGAPDRVSKMECDPVEGEKKPRDMDRMGLIVERMVEIVLEFKCMSHLIARACGILHGNKPLSEVERGVFGDGVLKYLEGRFQNKPGYRMSSKEWQIALEEVHERTGVRRCYIRGTGAKGTNGLGDWDSLAAVLPDLSKKSVTGRGKPVEKSSRKQAV